MGKRASLGGTRAIDVVTQAGVSFSTVRYEHDPRTASYADEAAQALGVQAGRVLKTLVCRLGTGELVVAILPSDRKLSPKALASAAGAKSAEMAAAADAERATGYVTGAISPLGQRKRLRTFVDAEAQGHATVFVSAGRRGLELEVALGDLVAMTGATVAPLAAE